MDTINNIHIMKNSEIFGFFTEGSENIPYCLIKYSDYVKA